MEYFMEDQRASDKEEGELTSNDEDDYNCLLKDIVARENVRMGQEHIRSPDCFSKGEALLARENVRMGQEHMSPDCFSKGEALLARENIRTGQEHIRSPDCFSKGEALLAREYVRMGQEHMSPNCFSKGEAFLSARMKYSRKWRKRHRKNSHEHQHHKSESRNETLSQLNYKQPSPSSGRPVLKHKQSVKMTSSPPWHKHKKHSRRDNTEELESPKWEQEFEDPIYYQNENRQTDRDSESRSAHWSNDRNFTSPELRNEGNEFRNNTTFGRTNTGKIMQQEEDMHQTDEADSRISEYSYTERLTRFQDSLEKKHICTDVCQERHSKDAEQVQECQKFLKKMKKLAEFNPKWALVKLMKFHKSWHGSGRQIVSDLIQELQNVLHDSPANNTFHGRLKDLDEADQKPLLTRNNHGRYETEFLFVPNYRRKEPCPGEEISSAGRPSSDEQCYPNLSCQRFRQRPLLRTHSMYEVNSTGSSPALCQNAILFYTTTVNTPAQQQSPQFVFVPLIQPPTLRQETVAREEQFEDARKIEIVNNRIIVSKRSNSDLMDNENPFYQDNKSSDRNLTQQRGVFRELSDSHLRFPHRIKRHGSARRKQNKRISAWNESLQRPINRHKKVFEERGLSKLFRKKITPHNAFTSTDDSSSSEENVRTEKSQQIPVNERKFLFANQHIDNLVPSTKTVPKCENYETNNQFESSIQNIPHKKLYSPHTTPNERFVTDHSNEMRSEEVENGSVLAVTPYNVKRTLLPTPKIISKSYNTQNERFVTNNFSNDHSNQIKSEEVENGSVLAVTPYNVKRTLLSTPKIISKSYVCHKRQRLGKCSIKTVTNRSSSVEHSPGSSEQRSSCILQVWPPVDDSCAERTPTYGPPAKQIKYSSPLCDNNTAQIVPSIELSDNMNNCDLKLDTDSEDEASILRRKLLEDREKRKRSTENHSVQLTEARTSVEENNMNLQPADMTQAGEQLVMKQLIDDQKSSQIVEKVEGISPPLPAFNNNFNNTTPLQPLSESCTIKVEYSQRDECNGDEVKDHLGCLLKKESSQSGIFKTCQTVQCLSKELQPMSIHTKLDDVKIRPSYEIKNKVFVDCTNSEQTIDDRNDVNKTYREAVSRVNKCLNTISDLPSLIELCRNCLQTVGHDKQGSDQQNPYEFSQNLPLMFSVLDFTRTNPSSESLLCEITSSLGMTLIQDNSCLEQQSTTTNAYTELTGQCPTVTYTELPGQCPTVTYTELPGQCPTNAYTELPRQCPTVTYTELPGQCPTVTYTELTGQCPTDTYTELTGQCPTDTYTELPLQSTTTDAHIELPGQSTTTDAHTELPGQCPTDAYTELPVQSTTTDAHIELPGQSTTTDAHAELPVQSTTTDAYTEPSGQFTTTDASTELTGQSTFTDAHTELSGQCSTDAYTELSGQCSTDAHTELSGQCSTDAYTEPSGQSTITDAHTELPGQCPTDAHTELPGQCPTDAYTELLGKCLNDAHTELPVQSDTTDAHTELPGQCPTDAYTELLGQCLNNAHTELPVQSTTTDVHTKLPGQCQNLNDKVISHAIVENSNKIKASEDSTGLNQSGDPLVIPYLPETEPTMAAWNECHFPGQKDRYLFQQTMKYPDFIQGPNMSPKLIDNSGEENERSLESSMVKGSFIDESIITLSPKIVKESFSDGSKNMLPLEIVKESFSDGSKNMLPHETFKESFSDGSKNMFPHEAVKEFFSDGSKNMFPHEIFKESFSDGSKNMLPHEIVKESFSDESKSKLPHEIFKESFSDGSKNMLPHEAVKESFSDGSKSALPHEIVKESFFEGPITALPHEKSPHAVMHDKIVYSDNMSIQFEEEKEYMSATPSHLNTHLDWSSVSSEVLANREIIPPSNDLLLNSSTNQDAPMLPESKIETHFNQPQKVSQRTSANPYQSPKSYSLNNGIKHKAMKQKSCNKFFYLNSPFMDACRNNSTNMKWRRQDRNILPIHPQVIVPLGPDSDDDDECESEDLKSSHSATAFIAGTGKDHKKPL